MRRKNIDKVFNKVLLLYATTEKNKKLDKSINIKYKVLLSKHK